MAYIYRRGNVWWGAVYKHGKRIRRTLATSDREKAAAICANVFVDLEEDYKNATALEIHRYLSKGFYAACARDKKRGRVAELSIADLDVLEKRANGRCELTGIPFSLTQAPGTSRRPFAPSIDRINLDKPYSLENCRIVCVSVNVAINAWGVAVFRRIATAIFLPETQKCPHKEGHTSEIIHLKTAVNDIRPTRS